MREFDANQPALISSTAAVQAGPTPAGRTDTAITGASGSSQLAGTTSRRQGPLPRMIRPPVASSSRPGPTNPAGGEDRQLTTQGPQQIYPRPPGADQIPNPLYSQPLPSDPSVIYVRNRPASKRLPAPAPAPSDGHGCPAGCFWLPRARTRRIPVPCPRVRDSRKIPAGFLLLKQQEYIELNIYIIILKILNKDPSKFIRGDRKGSEHEMTPTLVSFRACRAW